MGIGVKKYYPTRHAVDRLALRFGVGSAKASAWVNDKMKNAVYVGSNGRNGLTYESGEYRLVIDDKTGAVITVHSKISTDFLSEALAREMRKIKREHIRNVRKTEKRRAYCYTELAEMMLNHANARNPNTRKIIESRINAKENQIKQMTQNIERMKDEHKQRERAAELIAE